MLPLMMMTAAAAAASTVHERVASGLVYTFVGLSATVAALSIVLCVREGCRRMPRATRAPSV